MPRYFKLDPCNEMNPKLSNLPTHIQKKLVDFLLGTALIITTSSIFLVTNQRSTVAQSCTPFPVVGGEGNEVQKTVSVPGVPIPRTFGLKLNNNWNTDFAISPLRKYKQYVTNFRADSEGDYTIRVYLKYSDNTADEVYNQKLSLTPGKTLTIPGSPRTEEIPYQVNVFVGEPTSVGRTYTISVKGCN